MRITKISMCAAALSAAMLTGCSMMGGGGGGATTAQNAQPDGTPGVAETAGNVAIQAGATQAMKSSAGGVGGSIGYGLQSQSGNLSRALFGKKKQPAPQQPNANGTPSAASSSSSGTISTK